MSKEVVEYYQRYREEDRLTTNNARKLEFVTTTRIFDGLFGKKLKILDCAAGTGAYAFYLADRGHEVTATDITPRHIEVICATLQEKSYDMQTAVLDATDMRIFEDETFDVVLNMGPFYHLTEADQREKCMSECLRVLKKGGLFVTAYIPRFYVFQYVAMRDTKYLDVKLAERLIQTGVLKHEDEMCFWTDAYYATKREMEQMYQEHGVEVVDHFAQDGLAPAFTGKVDKWDEQQFKTWCDYHYNICREESILGASNHVIIVGRKNKTEYL